MVSLRLIVTWMVRRCTSTDSFVLLGHVLRDLERDIDLTSVWTPLD
jgi:hypothetical protein